MSRFRVPWWLHKLLRVFRKGQKEVKLSEVPDNKTTQKQNADTQTPNADTQTPNADTQTSNADTQTPNADTQTQNEGGARRSQPNSEITSEQLRPISELPDNKTTQTPNADTQTQNEDVASRSQPNGKITSEQLSPISELWNEAFEELSTKNPDLLKFYNEELSKVSILSEKDATMTGKSHRRHQMEAVISQKTKELEENKWKASFFGHELVVKDLIEPVFNIVDAAQEFIGEAVSLSGSPYASLAWSGLCLLLPQEERRADALDDISNIIKQCSIREQIYNTVQSSVTDTSTHIHYRESLKNLYVEILAFNATWVCFFTSNSFKRFMKDSIKLGDWKSMIDTIKKRDQQLKNVEEQWIRMEMIAVQAEQHQTSQRVLEEIKNEMQRYSEHRNNAQAKKDRIEILRWLGKVDPSVNYNAIRGRHGKSTTNNWLVEDNATFKRWKNSPNSFLWLHGKAGAGKSVISSTIIHHLKQEEKSNPYTALSYFFFTFDDVEKKKQVNLLKSWVQQLCARRPDVPNALLDLNEFMYLKQDPSLDDLKDTLKATVEGFSKIYMICDGLDECPIEEIEQILKAFEEIRSWDFPNVHILLSSRREVFIEKAITPMLKDPNFDVIDLELFADSINRDLGTFIDEKFKSFSYTDTWSTELKSKVKTALIKKANGMFQYVVLQLGSDTSNLLLSLDDESVDKALDKLPRGLDETYERAFQTIHESYRSRAIRAISWLAFFSRPITIGKLAEAVNFDCSQTTFSHALDDEKRILNSEHHSISNKQQQMFTPDEVLKLLPRGLIVIFDSGPSLFYEPGQMLPSGYFVKDYEAYDDEFFEVCYRRKRNQSSNAKIIAFSHFSVKEFVLSPRIKASTIAIREFALDESVEQPKIAELCLQYHLHLSKIVQPESQRHETMQKHRLLKDGILHAFAYLDITPYQKWDSLFQDLISQIFQPLEKPFETLHWVWHSSGTNPLFSQVQTPEFSRRASPVYFATQFGYEQLVYFVSNRIPTDMGTESQPDNTIGTTALNFATLKGKASLVKYFLKKGADPFISSQFEKYGRRYSCTLEIAIREQNLDCVKTILESTDLGCSQYEKIRYFPLFDAIKHFETEEMLKVLFCHVADVDSMFPDPMLERYGSLLDRFSKRFENRERERLDLMRKGAFNECTPLYLAAGFLFNQPRLLNCLLKQNPNVNAQSGCYGKAIFHAASKGYVGNVTILLLAGAKIDLPDTTEWENVLQNAKTLDSIGAQIKKSHIYTPGKWITDEPNMLDDVNRENRLSKLQIVLGGASRREGGIMEDQVEGLVKAWVSELEEYQIPINGFWIK